MSTRSAIIMKEPDGAGFAGIYCHFDGYESGVGKTLLEHYSDPAKVAALIALGDISCLGERVEPKGRHSYDEAEDGTTVAYMRDRGEKGLAAKRAPTASRVAQKIGHNGYIYVFDGNGWTCNGMPLAEAIKAEEEEEGS